MKLEEADLKALYTQWKKVFLSYVDLYKVFTNIEYLDDDELTKLMEKLEELLYAIEWRFRVIGGEVHDEY